MSENNLLKKSQIMNNFQIKNIHKIKKNLFMKNIKKNYKIILIIFYLFLILLIILFSFKLNYLYIYINENKEKKITDNSEKKNKNIIKICICTPGKRENRYINEFVQFYKKIGIDQIIIYDNNDINEESFEDIIKNDIDKGFVKIMNWRGIKNNTGFIIREDCYLKNKNKFDWLIFFDIDEYIHLNNYTNIKEFLNEEKFKNCIKINLNWVIHTDNNLFYYDNRTLYERFPELEPNVRNGKHITKVRYKSILRGENMKENKRNYGDLISTNIKGCNGDGSESDLINNKYMRNFDFKNLYIDHYYSKSVEEFVEKINNGDNYFGNKASLKNYRIKRYFKINKITIEKINFIENYTGIDLSEFKKKLIVNYKKN